MEVLYTFSNTRLQPVLFEKLLQRLPSFMRKSVCDFLHWEDAQLALFGKLLLLEAVKREGYDESILEKIQYTPFNRPFFSFFDFNISHSSEIVVCAWSKSARVGIDVEKIKAINYQQFTDQFTLEELESIRCAHDPTYEFYNYWTRKEAIIKADGLGLNIPLKEIKFVTPFQAHINAITWFINKIEIQNGYVCHVASDTFSKEIKVSGVFL